MHPPQAPGLAPQISLDNRHIEISHADWGLNCLDAYTYSSDKIVDAQPAPIGNYAENNATLSLTKDNVVATVKSFCDKQVRCKLTNNAKNLGTDPSPRCEKKLSVEYRCFAYDRPWIIEIAADQSAVIDCMKQ